MAQNTIFAQVIKLIPRSKFEAWVTKHNSDYRVRTLNTWTWFGGLLYGQLTGHDSIRALERVFSTNIDSLKKLGFSEIRRSTLSDANSNRTLDVLENCFHYILQKAQFVAPKKTKFQFKGNVCALDTTIIQLCLKLSPWAHYQNNKGAVKLHTAIDIAGKLPQFQVITEGGVSDYKTAMGLDVYEHGTTYVFDKAYMGYPYLNQLNQKDVYFVTRAKANCKFKVVSSNPVNKKQGLRCDQVVYANTRFGKRYKGKLRRVTYRDPQTNNYFVFITNRFDLSARTICELYKSRWEVEVFFKTLKQNLRVKKFLGNSVNAVKAQVLIALIAYLLIQLIRYSHKTRISMPDTMAVIGTMLVLKIAMKKLLGDLPRTTRHPPDAQLCFNL